VTARDNHSPDGESASQLVDAIVNASGDWRSATLSRLRAEIKKADPSVIEEVKWRKPTRPMGVPVWSHNGIICIGEALKSAVRLTFSKGALMRDPNNLFNTRLGSKTVRAIDVREGDTVDASALRALIHEAVTINQAKATKR
jgi:hypothetical protein